MHDPLKKLIKLGRIRWKWLIIPGSIAAIALSQPVLWPDGFGFKADKSFTTTVEKDSRGKITKTVETTKTDPGKTLWDWLSLLGVPITLAILGYLLQQIQQKRAEDEAKEEVLQVYFDRLSALLVDKNLLAIAAKVNSEEPERFQATQEELELLNSAVDVLRARTLSIFRRFENDKELITIIIKFLIEADFISKLKLNLSSAELSGAHLSDAHLSGAHLRHADFSGANLRHADLSYADLSYADLSYTNLSGANLKSANLSHANLRHADLSYANLSHANFGGAFLNNADLSSADLSSADLICADFSGAFLKKAKLSSAVFMSAHFNGADLSGVDLSYADLSHVNLSSADLSGANLESARPVLANLSYANLSHANLSRADLDLTDLRGANLRGANLRGANLRGANLSNARNFSDEQIKSAKFWERATYGGRQLNDPEVSKIFRLDAKP